MKISNFHSNFWFGVLHSQKICKASTPVEGEEYILKLTNFSFSAHFGTDFIVTYYHTEDDFQNLLRGEYNKDLLKSPSKKGYFRALSWVQKNSSKSGVETLQSHTIEHILSVNCNTGWKWILDLKDVQQKFSYDEKNLYVSQTKHRSWYIDWCYNFNLFEWNKNRNTSHSASVVVQHMSVICPTLDYSTLVMDPWMVFFNLKILIRSF